MGIEAITVQQYKTTDGQTFSDRSEALQHQAEIEAAPAIARYRDECMADYTDRFKESVCRHLVAFIRRQAVENNSKEVAA